MASLASIGVTRVVWVLVPHVHQLACTINYGMCIIVCNLHPLGFPYKYHKSLCIHHKTSVLSDSVRS